MRWEEWLARREGPREAALAAAAALERGEDAPARAFFDHWRCAADATALLARLRQREPRPPPGALAAALLPPDRLPAPPAEAHDVAPRLHRRRLSRALRGGVEDGPPARRAWQLESLAFWGAEVERLEREAWRRERYPADPALDARAAALWTAWFTGDLLRPWKHWRTLYYPQVERAFAAVMEAAGTPVDRRDRVREELPEEVMTQLLTAPDGVPGWLELAVRTLETGAPGPVDALAPLLTPEHRGVLAGCAVRQSPWSEAVSAVVPLPLVEHRLPELLVRLGAHPGAIEAGLDGHVVVRLLDAWAEDPAHTDPAWTWRAVAWHRGRSRGRLRALVLRTPPGVLLPAILGLPGLHARTAAATRRYAWAWAWRKQDGGFAFDPVAVTPPCEARPGWWSPYSEDDARAARAWVLLAVLRGHLDRLRRWTTTGSTGDHVGTWARLLLDLPASLRDPRDAPAEGREVGSYRRLRAWLGEELPATLAGLREPLGGVASCRPDRTLKDSMLVILDPLWHPAVPRPASGFPTMRAHADAALATLSPPEEP